MKVIGVADSDSYLKWGAAVIDAMPPDWDRELIVLTTPVAPSAAQRDAAVVGTRFAGEPIAALDLDGLANRVARERPDVVFLALRGPAVRVVARALAAAMTDPPVLVSGMPGISYPPTRRALLYRGRVDLLLVHSKRERAGFAQLAAELGIEQSFALASLAFLSGARPGRRRRDTVVFATQAKVPAALDDRLLVLRWLFATAERHPDQRVVVKLRARDGEPQTHAERYPYDTIALELGEPPANLTFETGSMADHLARAIALVTVSSTAALEAAASGVPALVLDDFGVTARLINLVFAGSNLLGSSRDLLSGRFRVAHPDWLAENYFHPRGDDDWLDAITELARRRAAGELARRGEARAVRGGALRYAWDRKRVFGHYDRSVSGRIALAVGLPVRWLYLTVRGTRRARPDTDLGLT